MTIVNRYVKDMDNIANVLENLTVDEQLEFMKMNDLISESDDLPLHGESEMTDEQCLLDKIRES